MHETHQDTLSNYTAASGSISPRCIGKHFWINIILTILGYTLDIINAVWVIAKNK